MQFLVPLAVLIHTVGGAQVLKLYVVFETGKKKLSLFSVHGNVVHIRDFQFRNTFITVWTGAFMSIQHMDMMATLTIVHVHHEKFPFSQLIMLKL